MSGKVWLILVVVLLVVALVGILALPAVQWVLTVWALFEVTP